MQIIARRTRIVEAFDLQIAFCASLGASGGDLGELADAY